MRKKVLFLIWKNGLCDYAGVSPDRKRLQSDKDNCLILNAILQTFADFSI
jgi:hypothetical protein